MIGRFEGIKNLMMKFIPNKIKSLSQKLFIKILYYYYSGDNYICPFCGGHYRRLLSYGSLKTPNRCCPIDQSLGRHRLLWIYLRKNTNIFSSDLKILHFSPQKCFQDYFKNMNNPNYITADLYSSEVMVKMNITNILYKDNYFDYVICLHVLEHVEEDQKAMAELFRVLKPGGLVIIQSPIDKSLEITYEDPTIKNPENRKKAFGQEDHVRVYGKDFESRLINAGFSVIVEDYAKKLGEPIINRYKLREDEIYICSKPGLNSL